MDEIYSKLTELLQNLFDDDGLQATPELTPKAVDGWDSLANVRLMLSAEDMFQVRFLPSEIMSFENLGDVANAIVRKLPHGAGED